MRDSPARAVTAQILAGGAVVRVYDPEGTDNARTALPGPAYRADVMAACRDVEPVLHLTEWRQYRALDPAEPTAAVRMPRVLDARNTLDRAARHPAGTSAPSDVPCMGRSRVGPEPSG
ncbi:UDP binding domain-containing protein [Streptomyces sp. NRRL B-2790]|uniref:UDP binding domain-containing protein n=1 Tax=Streptomyces sp. NRRL B-2790 TaxID=1463835 RepID=UPI0035613474